MNPKSKICGTTTALFFETGNVVHTGSKTEEHARLAAHELVHFLNEQLKIPASVNNFQITNMVADFKAGFEINLHEVQEQLGANAVYHPKRFPACRITSLSSPSRKGLIYYSGGIVLMGLKNRTEIVQLHQEVWSIVEKHKLKKSKVSKSEFRSVKEKMNVEEGKIKKINKSLAEMDSLSVPFKKEIKNLIRHSKKFKLTADASYSRSVNPLNPLMLTDEPVKKFVPSLML